LYYLASMNSDGIERPCDFGFDMLERIILDECFKSLKEIPASLIKGKKFCFYEHKPVFDRRQIFGLRAEDVCTRFNIYIGYDTCVATVVDGPSLYSTLLKLRLKIYNLPEWHCKNYPEMHGLFDSWLVYDPYTMRRMLSEKKYGHWNHNNDRKRAIRVLDKFIGFLEHSTIPDAFIIYNEIFCSRWDATGELFFDTKGLVADYRYFGEGKAFSYIYDSKVQIWQRV